MTHERETYISWLVMLGALLDQARRCGLLSIDTDVHMPRQSTIFINFPATEHSPYRDFAFDILQLICDGYLEAEDLKIYADTAVQSYQQTDIDRDLMQCIWLTIWGAAKGFPPRIAVEYGRQAMPASIKISKTELQNQLQAYLCKDLPQDTNAKLDSAVIYEFVASLQS